MSDTPLLVDTRWLSRNPHLRIADLRWSLQGPPGRVQYDAGHIPGAAFVDLDRDLSQPGGPGRHPLPSADSFARVLSRIGVGEGVHVVVYDQRDGSVSARLWFMLRAFGHPQVSLLDGGLDAWVSAGLPLQTAEGKIEPAPLRRLTLDGSRIVEVAQVQGRGDAVLLDARAPERYRGEMEPIDKKAGHIPGAVNAPHARNVDAQGRFRPARELHDLYERYGADVIVSCGSGVTACNDAFAMELAGLPPARLYVGSWSGWIEDPSRPIALGPKPG